MLIIKRMSTSRDLNHRIEVVFDSKFHDYILRLYEDGFRPCLEINHLDKDDCNCKFEKVVRFLLDIDGVKTIEVR